MYKYLIDDIYLKRYDFIFYLPFIETKSFKDGTRFQTIEQIIAIDQHMSLFFGQQKVENVFRVEQSFDKRLEFVLNKIFPKE
jgi:hypothetical protein